MNNAAFRTEEDFLGSREIPADALFGIHSLRAHENFPDQTPFHPEWYVALATTKKACYITAQSFFEKSKEKLQGKKLGVKEIEPDVFNVMILVCGELEQQKHFADFIVPAISGGAGTSINLNINEIIANRSLQLLGQKPGAYQRVDPIEHANIFQSTNDVVPTALKVASIKLLEQLEGSINNLREPVERLEKAHLNDLRKGFTQMQEAVPSSYGRLFGTYSDALSRDWWRISKCFERIKVVNLGGSAIGSGITVPRFFIMEAARTLQRLTGLPVTRGENLHDATNNLDALVEVHGILKAHAVNLEKMVSDLRLMGSDIYGNKEVELPKKQAGSSIMPGKVNPVIPEYVISCAHKVYANDVLITSLSAQGCLELNAYLPVIGHHLLESIKLLISCNRTLRDNLISGMTINAHTALQNLYKSPSVSTALVPFIGYNKAAEVALFMKENNVDIFEANTALQLFDTNQLKEILSAQNLLKEGFSINDIIP